MAPAFEDAAAQRGTGTRDRMLAILHEAATDTADTMFAEVRVAVDDLLSDLTTYIAERSRQLVTEVCGEADALARLVTETAADCFTQDVPDGFVDTLTALEERIGDLVPRLGRDVSAPVGTGGTLP